VARYYRFGIDRIGLAIGRVALALRIVAAARDLAAAFNEDVSLERVFPRETLVAVGAREGLHGEMDSLMPLQVMVPVEALRALVALERTVVCSRLLLGMSQERAHAGSMAAIEPVHHTVRHTANERKLAIRVRDIRVYGGRRESNIPVRPLGISMGRLSWGRGNRWNRALRYRWRHPWHGSSGADGALLRRRGARRIGERRLLRRR
jgi:hypothetical protein